MSNRKQKASGQIGQNSVKFDIIKFEGTRSQVQLDFDICQNLIFDPRMHNPVFACVCVGGRGGSNSKLILSRQMSYDYNSM